MSAVERFFFAEVPVRGVVLFRVGLAVWTAGLLAMRVPYLAALHGEFPLGRSMAQSAWIVPHLPLWAFYALYGAAFLVLAAFAIGWQARLMHSLFLLIGFVILGWDHTLLRAYGKLAAIQWVILFATPFDLPAGARAPAWGLRLLQMQFCSVYLFTVAAKLTEGSGWQDGAALYYLLRNPLWARDWVMDWLSVSREVATAMGWAVLAGELFVGLGLWWSRTRRLAMLACFGLHLGIELMMRVPMLFPTIMWLHIVLFVEWRDAETPAPCSPGEAS